MDPNLRNAVLIAGLVFVGFFVAMTLVVVAQDGITVPVVFAGIVIALLGVAVWGAINSPNDRR